MLAEFCILTFEPSIAIFQSQYSQKSTRDFNKVIKKET